ncbi:MAG: hypothetical protein LLG00_16345 [Planctomycetaceae bacterium]|nr:hypothetical protein [Planctomycetaceae bacterium]
MAPVYCSRLCMAICAFLACALSGCLFVRHSTHVVREKEPIHPVRFESEQAKTVFEAGVHQLQAHKETSGGGLVAVPFICWYSHVNELSDNAIYNDQESACDLNGDNLISLEEALAYRSRVEQRVAAIDKPKGTDAKPEPPGGGPIARNPGDFTPPPGLLH